MKWPPGALQRPEQHAGVTERRGRGERGREGEPETDESGWNGAWRPINGLVRTEAGSQRGPLMSDGVGRASGTADFLI